MTYFTNPEERIKELTVQAKNQAEIITALEKELIQLYREKANLNQMVTDLLTRVGQYPSNSFGTKND